MCDKHADESSVQWVALKAWGELAGISTAECSKCEGKGWLWGDAFGPGAEHLDCPECDATGEVAGRRIVPLYTDERCKRCNGFGIIQTGSSLSADDPAHHRCTACDGIGRRRVGQGSIEVVPVLDNYGLVHHERPVIGVSRGNTGWVWLWMPNQGDPILLDLDPLPVPGRDWGIVIDCVEVV